MPLDYLKREINIGDYVVATTSTDLCLCEVTKFTPQFVVLTPIAGKVRCSSSGDTTFRIVPNKCCIVDAEHVTMKLLKEFK